MVLRSRVGASMRSVRSNWRIFCCTCLALVFLARKRRTKLSAASISRCWFLAALHERLVALALLHLEVVVVARVEVDDAAVEVGDMRGHAVEEVAVVADDHEGAGPAQQELLQPEEALQVEMVGGLVHEQQVRLLEQQTGECDPHAPAPGQLHDGPLEVLLAEAHAAQDGLRPGLEFVPLRVLEGRLQGPQLVQQRSGSAARRLSRLSAVADVARGRRTRAGPGRIRLVELTPAGAPTPRCDAPR